MPSISRKPRFVLVDPSFDGKTGDKWQYAVAFAASAVANGYEFHLASAKNSPSISDSCENIIEHRIFSYGFYQHDKIVLRHDNPEERARFMRETRRINRAEQAVKEAWDRNDRGAVELADTRLRMVKREAAKQSRAAEERLTDDQIFPFNRDDFGLALADLIQELDLQRGDRLFFHTITPAMMESLAEARVHLGLERLVEADAHFLFHFGAEASDAATFLDRYHSYSAMPSMAQRLKTGSPFLNNYFLATSTDLAEECETMFGVPCGLFEGLANLDAVQSAIGGPDEERHLRQMRQGEALLERPFKVTARAVDLNDRACESLLAAHQFMKAQGVDLDIRVIYHGGALGALRDIAAILGDVVTFVDTDDNDDYTRAIAQSDLMVLSYVPEHYAKRVSAVLHDCSVVGVPCLVPAKTTMVKSSAYADISIFEEIEDLPGLIYGMWRRRSNPDEAYIREAKVEEARRRFATDVVTRVVNGQTEPAVVAHSQPRVAVVVMPSWKRCGSSFAMEAQIRFLVSQGYFVVQTFLFDQPVEMRSSMAYLWTILADNSVYARGHVQRCVYATPQDIQALIESDGYLALSPFYQHLVRIEAASLHEPVIEALCKAAELTLVNHVFHSRWAKKYCGGASILETHDIQSYQMAKWPLIDAATEQPAGLGGLLRDEFAEVGTFDHVVNVAPEEHRVLSLAAKQATLVVPYIPVRAPNATVNTVSEFRHFEGWDEWYEGIDTFDMLLAGDAHKANVESAIWFIDQVFKPYLQPLGYNLVITGRLSQHLFQSYEGTNGIFFAGFVKDLTTVRALSKVSLLPDQRGTGISIKTLETFQEGAPYVATSVAIRGLQSEQIQELETFDEAESYAEEIKRLLKSKAARDVVSTAGRAAYLSVCGEALFNEKWRDILGSLPRAG